MSKSSGSFGNDAAMSLRVELQYKREGQSGIRQRLVLRAWRTLRNLLAIFIASTQFVDGTDEAGASLNKANKLRSQKIAR